MSGQRSESHQPIDSLQGHGTDEIIHCMSGERRRGIRAVFLYRSYLEFGEMMKSQKIRLKKRCQKLGDCGVLEAK